MNGIFYPSIDSLPHTGPPPAVIAYCERCQEQLIFMGRSTCPVCKLDYDTERPETFLSKPSFLWWKYWFPGLFLAVAFLELSLIGSGVGITALSIEGWVRLNRRR